MSDIDGTPPSPGRDRPDWMSKAVIPVLVAVVGAILVTALTPLGDRLREVFFPTKVDVKGTAFVDRLPAARARVALDGKVTQANDSGAFVVRDVGTGRHTLTIKSLNSKEYSSDDVKVERRSSDVDLGKILLNPLSRLGVDGSVPVPSPGGGAAFDTRLWIAADAAFLSQIRSIEYVLPSPFPAVAVGPTSGPEQSFCLRKTQTFPTGGGERFSAQAKVVLKSGQEFPLVWLPGDLSAPIPQACPPGSAPPGPAPTPPPPAPQPPPPAPPPPPPPPPSPQVRVPKVVDQLYESASAQLHAKGLAVKRLDVDSTKPKNTVVDQNPDSGTLLSTGATVTLSVSKGPKQVNVPDVSSQTEAGAKQTLGQSGFAVDVQQQDVMDPSLDGLVLSQNPRGGVKAKPGATVTIVVGRFVEP